MSKLLTWETLDTIGVALFGENWKSEMARRFGIDRRTVQTWSKTGTAKWVVKELGGLIEARKAEIAEAEALFNSIKEQMMNLSYEYNDYLVGYVVTDKDTGRTCNFQFEQIMSNHPQPDFHVRYGCEGEDSYTAFNDDEREEMTDWLRAHKDVRQLERDYTDAYYFDAEAATAAPLTETEIEALAAQAKAAE